MNIQWTQLAVLFLLPLTSQAAVLNERSVTIGHQTHQTIVLREHEMNKAKGFSVIRMDEDRIVGVKIISAKEYQNQLKDLDYIFSKKLKEKSAQLSYCNDTIELGRWQKEQPAKKEKICLTPASEATKLSFKTWWWKTTHL